jgi:GxxExxY protein
MFSGQIPPSADYSKLRHGDITEKIIAAAIEVHRQLGPGLLESIYEQCLCHELTIRQVGFERQRALNVDYKGLKIECAYRPDLLVEDVVVVELKAAEQNLPIFEAQLLTYLKLSNRRVGLLINFGMPVLRNGIIRRVN